MGSGGTPRKTAGQRPVRKGLGEAPEKGFLKGLAPKKVLLKLTLYFF